jgi:ATP-binding cassette subfamily C protein LapB
VDLRVFLAAIGINILGLALPLVTLQVYDRIIANANYATLSLLWLGLAIALVLDAALRAVRSIISGWIGARYEHNLACSAVDRLLSAPLVAAEAVPPGELLDQLAAVDPLREFHINQGPLILIDLPFAALFLGVIWLISGPLALVPLGLLAVFGLVAVWNGRLLRTALHIRATLDERRFSFLIEAFSGVHSIKALGMEPMMARRYERLLDAAGGAAYRTSSLGGNAQAIGILFSQIATVATLLAGAWLVLDGRMTTGALAACTMLAGRALQPLLQALGIWTHFQSIRVARQRLGQLFRRPPAVEPASTAPENILGQIEFRNLHFGYDGESKLLAGANLVIRPGEAVAISGRNGSGKTTSLHLMAGILTPTEGQVLLDGRDLGDFDPSMLRRQIGLLPQQGNLFRGTMLQNMTFFRGAEVVDEALSLAGELGLDGFAARLPQGYQTRVADGPADALPGGVRQRIAIVRSLCQKPPIVLFDEANTSLDDESDEKLRELLKRLKGRVTLVLISYRPSIQAVADRVLRIENGLIVPVTKPAAGRAAARVTVAAKLRQSGAVA